MTLVNLKKNTEWHANPIVLKNYVRSFKILKTIQCQTCYLGQLTDFGSIIPFQKEINVGDNII